jgi:hypothetical protein
MEDKKVNSHDYNRNYNDGSPTKSKKNLIQNNNR